MKFQFKISQEWTEPGTIEITADSEDDARDIFDSGAFDDDIEWQGSNMDPGERTINSVEKI